jgi:glycosyltransferase involved in cell wall biosynthesis
MLNKIKPKVLFIINSIGYGGAERALVNILYLQDLYSTYDVHLVLLDDEPLVREIPVQITVHVLDSKRSLLKTLYNLFLFCRTLKPAICISFLVRANISNILIGKILASYPTIICERMHLDSHLNGQFSGIKRRLAKMLPKLIYKYAAEILGVSTGVTKNLNENFNVPEYKSSTIFNPYNIAQIEELGALPSELDIPVNFIISVGRLTNSKNFECLIDAYLCSDETVPLVILGTGNKENELRSYIERNDIEGRIKLIGYANNPFSIISKAKYFVSASLNEGFPNAMLEAMVLKKAIVMSNCPSGPAEILHDDPDFSSDSLTQAKFGILVPINDTEALTKAINLFQNIAIREKYSNLAKLRSQNFELKNIAQQYWNFISLTLQKFRK